MKVLVYKSAAGRSPIADYITKLPEGDKARFAEVFEEIETNGLDAAGLMLKPLEGKLWEIKFRAVGGGFRILYVLPQRDTMVWLHAFHKKLKRHRAGTLN